MHIKWQRLVGTERIGKSLKVSRKPRKKAIRKGKMDYESKLAQNIKTDSKSFYEYIK